MGEITYLDELNIKHSIILVEENVDVLNLLTGHFYLARYNVHKTISAKECLDKIKELEGKVDVVLISGDIAAERGSMLIVNIKKLNSSIKVLTIADSENNKTRILGYGSDDFALQPISATTIVEKVGMLLMKKPAEAMAKK